MIEGKRDKQFHEQRASDEQRRGRRPGHIALMEAATPSRGRRRSDGMSQPGPRGHGAP
jgi:hypothetical protein